MNKNTKYYITEHDLIFNHNFWFKNDEDFFHTSSSLQQARLLLARSSRCVLVASNLCPASTLFFLKKIKGKTLPYHLRRNNNFTSQVEANITTTKTTQTNAPNKLYTIVGAECSPDTY
jgi:hypothetical protein